MLVDVNKNIRQESKKVFILSPLLLIFIFIHINTAHSFYDECEKPDVPDCADYLEGYSNRWDFENCKNELDSFSVELEEYLECIRRQINEIRSEYEDAIEKYNCKLKHEGFCY